MQRFGARPKLILASALLLVVLLVVLFWWNRQDSEHGPGAPVVADDPIVFPNEPSYLALDLRADLAALETALEAEVPRTLWTIDEPGAECVAPKKIDLALFKVKTPKIKCDIKGTVTRGRLRISGSGRNLVVTMPVAAKVGAHDIAGIFSNESGSAAADVTLTVQLDLTPDWQLVSSPQLDYRWTEQPGIEFLGRRIDLTSTAESELEGVRGDVKRIVTRELANIGVREAAAEGWREAHAVVELNRENPAVWGRIVPQQVSYGGYSVEGRALIVRLGMDALIETFVGLKPKKPDPSPLPKLARREKSDTRSVLRIPVVADYAVLEPVIERALVRRSERPFEIEGFGTVNARFANVKVYGTPPGRIAVGADFAATSDLGLVPSASGRIWLAAKPSNDPNSRAIDFSNATVSGDTDLVGQPLLFALANSLEFQGTISDALAQNFENDFNELREKIDRALRNRRDGPLNYTITIQSVETGVIKAHGQGLYLPVEMTASARAQLVRIK